jgi:predicted solute-binding protein
LVYIFCVIVVIMKKMDKIQLVKDLLGVIQYKEDMMEISSLETTDGMEESVDGIRDKIFIVTISVKDKKEDNEEKKKTMIDNKINEFKEKLGEIVGDHGGVSVPKWIDDANRMQQDLGNKIPITSEQRREIIEDFIKHSTLPKLYKEELRCIVESYIEGCSSSVSSTDIEK